MSQFKLLIDTNIFIGLEDPKAVDPGLAELSRKCSSHGIRVFVHEAAKSDVIRDRDEQRRAISLPGNTIRKVYLCRAQTESLKSGDLLLFYQSKSPNFVTSQCLTSIGVAEDISTTNDFDELVRMTAKRSVFSEQELRELIQADDRPIKVINFLLMGHLGPPIPLAKLLEMGVFVHQPPQSIIQLAKYRFDAIKPHLNFGFEI